MSLVDVLPFPLPIAYNSDVPDTYTEEKDTSKENQSLQVHSLGSAILRDSRKKNHELRECPQITNEHIFRLHGSLSWVKNGLCLVEEGGHRI